MKKIFLIAIVLFCALDGMSQGKNYATFTADLTNRNGDTIYIRTRAKIIKKMAVNKAGVFKDTLNVKEGFYIFFDGTEYTNVFLKNGYDLTLKLDTKDFDNSIVYSGVGSVENNFIVKTSIADSKYDYDAILVADEATFNKLMSEKKASDIAALESAKLDPEFTRLQKQNIENSFKGLEQYYKETQAVNKMNNTVSPTFDYVNYAGGKSKLEDFRGKYVYIDVWATWCGPCRAEIPFLKTVEEKYHGKNIEFISISIDVMKDMEKWRTFVKDKQLGGVQLFADNDWKSQFIKDYSITGIPRFILIDPNGKIVKADAPRPSTPILQEQLDQLLN